MTFTAALVKEQGVTFAVVLVKHAVMGQGEAAKAELAAATRPLFPGVPIVLCAQDSSGRPQYWGRQDIVKFLANIYFEQLPWGEYSAN